MAIQSPNSLMLAYYESIFSVDYDVTHTAGIYHILPNRTSRLLEIDKNDEIAANGFRNEDVALSIREVKRQNLVQKVKILKLLMKVWLWVKP